MLHSSILSLISTNIHKPLAAVAFKPSNTMNFTELFRQAVPARNFNYEILSFYLAAVAVFFVLLRYNAKIHLPGFVFFD